MRSHRKKTMTQADQNVKKYLQAIDKMEDADSKLLEAQSEQLDKILDVEDARLAIFIEAFERLVAETPDAILRMIDLSLSKGWETNAKGEMNQYLNTFFDRAFADKTE
jgi:hypothetical protein